VEIDSILLLSAGLPMTLNSFRKVRNGKSTRNVNGGECRTQSGGGGGGGIQGEGNRLQGVREGCFERIWLGSVSRDPVQGSMDTLD